MIRICRRGQQRHLEHGLEIDSKPGQKPVFNIPFLLDALNIKKGNPYGTHCNLKYTKQAEILFFYKKLSISVTVFKPFQVQEGKKYLV